MYLVAKFTDAWEIVATDLSLAEAETLVTVFGVSHYFLFPQEDITSETV